MADKVIDYSALGTVAVVTFTKKNGELREMVCTTNLALVPAGQQPKGTSTRVDVPDMVRAFDLNKNEWRSFYRSNVISLIKYDRK